MKENAHIELILPEGYAFRYTLNWLIRRKNFTEGVSITRIQNELAELTNRSLRNIQMWEKIKSDDYKGGIGIESAFILSNYFGIDVRDLITKNVVGKKASAQKRA